MAIREGRDCGKPHSERVLVSGDGMVRYQARQEGEPTLVGYMEGVYLTGGLGPSDMEKATDVEPFSTFSP